MKIKEIFNYPDTNVFVVTNDEAENELNWTLEPTDFQLIPEDERLYVVKALQVYSEKTVACYLIISTPERIADFVIKQNKKGKAIIEDYCEQEPTVIPAVASEVYGNYELYYSKENPQIGIDILKEGLTKAKNKDYVAEDLGYILQDENMIDEAINAFLICEQHQPSSVFIYSTLALLYGQSGQIDKQTEYETKYRQNGGL